MTTPEQSAYSGHSQYTCAECGKKELYAKQNRWKFCPHCGSEIIRFDVVPEHNVISVQLIDRPNIVIDPPVEIPITDLTKDHSIIIEKKRK